MKRTVVISMLLSVAWSASAFGLFGKKERGPGRERPPDGRAAVMEVKIGAVLPLSGVVASDGEAALYGLQIAEADLNASGDLPFRVKIEPRDGKFEPRESLNAFNLLLSRKVVGMLLIGDNTCQMTRMQVSRHEIPTVASMVVTERSVKGNPWMLRCWPPIATSSRIMAKYMRQSGAVTNAAVFHIDAVYGLESVKGFSAAFEAEGGRVTVRESFPFLASDLRSQVAKLLKARPDGIFVTGFGQGLITAINQLREGGWKGTVYTDTAVVDPRVKKNLSSLSDIVFIGNAFDEERAKGGKAADFARKYKEISASDSEEVPPQAPLAYTAAQMLVRGLAAARGSKPAVMKSIAESKEYRSVLGPVSYDEEREIVLPLFVKTFGPDGGNVLLDDRLWLTQR